MSKIDIFTNNLKNRKFDKKDSQNFSSEQATIANGQDASDNKKHESNRTSSQNPTLQIVCV